MALQDFMERLRRAFMRSNNRLQYQVLNQGRTPPMTPMFQPIQGYGVGTAFEAPNSFSAPVKANMASRYPDQGQVGPDGMPLPPPDSIVPPTPLPYSPTIGHKAMKAIPSNVPVRPGREFLGRYSASGQPIYSKRTF